ncbi:MAG: 4-hydroxy-tetrahydrodipicolinate reductase [Candidatus Melainabacteria bacterium]|nr:4-hydroxy-tetrahydrodipicolinate reductase [Candidatus Melainabacteria bacterium]
MTRVKVVIAGVNGRMGRAALAAMANDPGIDVVGAFGRKGAHYVGKPLRELVSELAPEHKSLADLSIADSFSSVLKASPDVVLDFMIAEASLELAQECIERGIHPVIGSSGLGEEAVKRLAQKAKTKGVGGLIVPNFSLGAVLMMEFAKQAARYFENSEVVELHHTKKLDAPSGTAMHTLNKMAASDGAKKFNQRDVEERELMAGARGAAHASGLRVHSLRLPGLISHQEVFFGSDGELLSVKHDSFNTSCFNKGMVMAVKAAPKLTELQIGLETIL